MLDAGGWRVSLADGRGHNGGRRLRADAELTLRILFFKLQLFKNVVGIGR